MAAQVPSRLYRSRSQRMIAGVCGGLGEYFDVDPVLIRLLFVVTAFISGVGILAYIVLWIVVPFEGDDSPRLDALKRDFDDISGRVRDYVGPTRPGGGPGAGGGTPPGSTTAGFAAESTAGDTPPAVDPISRPASGPASSPTAAPGSVSYDNPRRRPDSSTSPDTSSFEVGSMSADVTATSRLPRSDEPTTASEPTAATAADDLTLGTEPPHPSQAPPGPPHDVPPGPPPPPTPPPPWGAPTGEPTGTSYDPSYGSPYGPPVGAPTSFWSPPGAPTERRRRRQHWAGAILIILGLLILGSNLGLLRWARPEYILPLILVAAGAWLLFGRSRRG